MCQMTKFIVPPMCPDRVICQWQFEGGGFVAVVSFGGPDTTEKLDAVQRMIDLKREEIAKSAPVFKAAQNYAESDPAVTPDCAGADTAMAATKGSRAPAG